MSMHPFFQELTAAREAKGLTLAQISDITRIAESQLEALERGDVSILLKRISARSSGNTPTWSDSNRMRS